MKTLVTRRILPLAETRSRVEALFAAASRSKEGFERAVRARLGFEGPLPPLPAELASKLDLVTLVCPADDSTWQRETMIGAMEAFLDDVGKLGRLSFRLTLPEEGDRFRAFWVGSTAERFVSWECRAGSPEEARAWLEEAVDTIDLPLQLDWQAGTLEGAEPIVRTKASSIGDILPSFTCWVTERQRDDFVDRMLAQSSEPRARRDYLAVSKIPSMGRDVAKPIWRTVHESGWVVSGDRQTLALDLRSFEDFEQLRQLEIPLEASPKIGRIAAARGRWVDVAVEIRAGAPGYRLLFHMPSKREAAQVRELLPGLELSGVEP